PRHVGVARAIHSDALTALLEDEATTSEICGVDELEDRVDDQGLARVIGGDAKSDVMLVVDHVSAGNLLSDASDLLVDDGLPLADRAGSRVQHEVALGINFEAIGALEAEND